jgi:hypothetical protein
MVPVPTGSGSTTKTYIPTSYLGMGMKTGVELAKVVEAGNFISSALNRYFSPFSAEDLSWSVSVIF